MRRLFAIIVAAIALVGCTKDNIKESYQTDQNDIYHASFEEFGDKARTYVDEDVKLLWHEDDRISLFRTTLNEQFKFTGATGANSGDFTAVPSDEWVTGNQVSTNYAVYPYDATTRLSNAEIIQLTMPAVQQYAENSFGRGANMMVAAAENISSKFLPFRNLGGYIIVKLYGEDTTIKSIEFKGNNNEIIAGAASAEAKYGYLPVVSMSESGTTTITLDCGEEGVTISSDSANPTSFWFVVPPITFEGGFTFTITDINGNTFTKSTTKKQTVVRNEIKSMSGFEPTFEGEGEDPEVAPKPANNEIWYTNGSSTQATTPSKTDVFGANIVSNTYDTEKECWVIKFDGNVASIGNAAFRSCTSLTSVTIPDSVTLIGDYAFINCTSLTSLTIPNSVTSIGTYAFYGCNSLASITIPNSVTAIGEYAFGKCTGELLVNCNIPASTNGIFYCCAFSSVTIGDSVTIIGKMAFYDCYLTSVTIGNSVTTIGEKAFVACDGFTSVNIPDSVREIGRSAFDLCGNITSVTIGNSVTYIGYAAFAQCKNLASVYCKAITPPSTTLNDYGDCNVFMDNASNRQIYVPKESVEAYKRARGWSNYASYIQSLPYTPTECTALTITADDVCGNDTHTTIYYTAVTNGVDNGEYCSKTITGTCQSDEFPQNTSTTESIERTVSFTYLGQTATTTITQGPFVPSSYTISLNSAWRQSTSVSNPDSSLYDGVYESYSNYNVHSASAWMYIDIEDYNTFTIYVRSYAESSYDYVTVYNLDSTSSAKMTTKGNQQGGTSISSYTPVTFSNIGGGSHRIAIEYKKDSSQNSNSDRGYVLIPKNQ